MSSTAPQSAPPSSHRRLRTDDSDPYALPPDAVREPPATMGAALRHIGPGLILAGAIVGTGELIATTNLGAKVGFVLLWLVILSCFIKVFVQAELGRYAVSSGQTTFESFRELPGPGFLFGWWWVVMMLITQLQLGAMVGGVGQAMHLAAPDVSLFLGRSLGPVLGNAILARPELPWALVVAITTSIILAVGSYKLIEWVCTSLVVTFTLMTIVCVAMLPFAGHPIQWGEVGRGLTFTIPTQAAVVAAVAMFGITGVGATELIAYPYWCIEKGYARKSGPPDGSEAWLRRARGWLSVMRLDCWVSMVIYTVATIAFYFLGAAVLYTPGVADTGLPKTVGAMLGALTRMYEPVLGSQWALVFIVIGVIAVLYSTLFAATAANSRALADFVSVNGIVPFKRGSDRVRWIKLFCIVFPLIDFCLYIWLGSPVLMVVIGGFAQALTLPLMGAAAVYFRYRRVDRRLTPGMVWDVFLWLSFLGLVLAAGYGVWDTVGKQLWK